MSTATPHADLTLDDFFQDDAPQAPKTVEHALMAPARYTPLDLLLDDPFRPTIRSGGFDLVTTLDHIAQLTA